MIEKNEARQFRAKKPDVAKSSRRDDSEVTAYF